MLASVRKCANARATVSADAIGMSRSNRSMCSSSLSSVRARLGGLAHLLDPFENLVPFVMPQHTAEHFPEQAHVVSQRLVRIDTHPEHPISPTDRLRST